MFPITRRFCLLDHAEVDILRQMHLDGGAHYFVYGSPLFNCHQSKFFVVSNYFNLSSDDQHILHQTFSARCIRMVEHAILSMDLHSSVVIEVGFLFCRTASTCLLMIHTSCIISFHKLKFLPSNVWISTLVPNVEAIFVMINEIFLLTLFFFF